MIFVILVRSRSFYCSKALPLLLWNKTVLTNLIVVYFCLALIRLDCTIILIVAILKAICNWLVEKSFLTRPKGSLILNFINNRLISRRNAPHWKLRRRIFDAPFMDSSMAIWNSFAAKIYGRRINLFLIHRKIFVYRNKINKKLLTSSTRSIFRVYKYSVIMPCVWILRNRSRSNVVLFSSNFRIH